MHRLVAASAVVLLSLGLSSCGDDQEEQAKSSMSQSFQDQDLGGIQVDAQQADCMAGDIVDGVGVDQLQQYEILGADGTVNDDLTDARLEEEDADTVSAALVGCIGADTIVEEQVVQDQMTRPQKNCVREAMDEESLTRLISAGFQGADASDESVQQLREAMTACMKK